MFTEERFALFLTLFGEHDGFGFAHGIEDHSLFVEAIHGPPVMTFPCTSVVMDCQEEQREHHLVDFVLVVIHELKLIDRDRTCNRARAAMPAGDAGRRLEINTAGSAVKNYWRMIP